MDKRVFIRIDDDGQLDRIQDIADALRRSGLTVADVSPIVGQITGSVPDADLDRLQRQAQAIGVRVVSADDDAEHQLPPPDSDLQ